MTSGGVLFGLALSIGLLVALFIFLNAMAGTLRLCAPERLRIGPGQVWFTLLPGFAAIWVFFLVTGVSRTIGDELRARQVKADAAPGESLGLAWAVLSLLGWIPIVGWLFLLAGLVCWALYWAAVSKQATALRAG